MRVAIIAIAMLSWAVAIAQEQKEPCTLVLARPEAKWVNGECPITAYSNSCYDGPTGGSAGKWVCPGSFKAIVNGANAWCLTLTEAQLTKPAATK